MTRKSFLGVALLGTFLTSASQAVPIITQAGIDLGFTLTTVITNTPNSFPVGVAVNAAGNIVFYNYSGGVTSVIRDIDNQNYQTPGTVLSTANNAVGVPGMAYANGSVWMGGGTLRRLNDDGSTGQSFSNIQVGWGMWTNQATGHVMAFMNTTTSLADIDVSNPNAPTFTIIKNGIPSSDGLTISPDGTKAYTSGGSIIDLVNLAAPIGHFTPPSGADGMGVISSSNALNGKIIVNTTIGQIVMLDPLNNYAQTIIATGGGYGDFTGPDWKNGTLLVPSGNAIMRLSCGEGCGIGVAPPVFSDAPEPATSGLMAAALAGLVLLKRRMRS